MKYVVECSASTRECVVQAVLDRKGECDDLACLPTILSHETCDEYYDRCLDALAARKRAVLRWWHDFRSVLQKARNALCKCWNQGKYCAAELVQRLSQPND